MASCPLAHLQVGPGTPGGSSRERDMCVHGSSCRTFCRRSRSTSITFPGEPRAMTRALGRVQGPRLSSRPSSRLRRKVSRSALIAAFSAGPFGVSSRRNLKATSDRPAWCQVDVGRCRRTNTVPPVIQKWHRQSLSWRIDGETLGRPSQLRRTHQRGCRFGRQGQLKFLPTSAGTTQTCAHLFRFPSRTITNLPSGSSSGVGCRPVIRLTQIRPPNQT